jgi:hypothetical protein
MEIPGMVIFWVYVTDLAYTPYFVTQVFSSKSWVSLLVPRGSGTSADLLLGYLHSTLWAEALGNCCYLFSCMTRHIIYQSTTPIQKYKKYDG